MFERKLYKTKLCVLYQKGHCPRQNCLFAHGDAELRRFSGSFNVLFANSYILGVDARQPFVSLNSCESLEDYRGGDLRGKLGRRYSPQRRYSPGRDARGRHAFRGYSPSRSLETKRNRPKKQHLDGQSDFSESLKTSDETEDRVKRKVTSSNSKDVLAEQLKQVQSDIIVLDHQKLQLANYLEESVQEADSLTSRIEELEGQLRKEKDECRRITSKVKKFVKTHNRHSRIQDELKRSQFRLQKLGAQLGLETTRNAVNEEDSTINIVSDGETTGYHLSPKNKLQNNAFLSKKRLHVNQDIAEETKPEERGYLAETIRLEKISRWNVQHDQLNDDTEIEAVNNGNKGSLAKRGKHIFSSIPPADKLKGSGSGTVLTSTSMAAQAVDEIVDIELEEKMEVVEPASNGVEKAATNEINRFSFRLPAPPPVPQNTYSQYKGEDEMLDVEII